MVHSLTKNEESGGEENRTGKRGGLVFLDVGEVDLDVTENRQMRRGGEGISDILLLKCFTLFRTARQTREMDKN